MTTPRVGIATYSEMKALALPIARGQAQTKPADPKMWATSTASCA